MNRTASNMTNSYNISLDTMSGDTFWVEIVGANVVEVDSAEVNSVELVIIVSDVVACERV